MEISAQRPSDHVVLLDEAGARVGWAPRSTVHGSRTSLHLAFSCYLFDASGRLLVTRRALTKRSWPGVWTNSFCGHPRMEEPMPVAIARHARHELGLSVEDIRTALPDFRYRAVDASGVVENEICPVYLASTSEVPDPDPAEVMDLRWVGTEDLGRAVASTPWAFSPWMVEQLLELADLDVDLLSSSVEQELAG